MTEKLHHMITHNQSSGDKKTSEYRTWCFMKERCYNKNSGGYKYYGARGIKVCDRWHSFENFFKDMGKRTTKLHSLGRIDNDGNYELGNCRWETRVAQANNKRNNRILNFNGTKKTVAEWSIALDVKVKTLYSRLANGWSTYKTLTTPGRNKTK